MPELPEPDFNIVGEVLSFFVCLKAEKFRSPRSRSVAIAVIGPFHLLLKTLTALIISMTACKSRQSIFEPASNEAKQIIELWWLLICVSLFVFLWVCFVMLIGLRRSRKLVVNSDKGVAIEDRNMFRWFCASAVAVVFLIFILLIGGFRYSRFPVVSDQYKYRIEVKGQRWWWEIRYFDHYGEDILTTANEIHIPTGEPVLLRLTSNNIIHSFWVPQLAGKVDLIPGKENYLTLNAEKPGVFRGQCAEFCGIQHAKMSFLVVAQAKKDFAKWVDWQIKQSLRPRDELAKQGEGVFLKSGCPGCHTIRGLSEATNLGPDLTHIASRQSLVATFP